MGLMAFSPMGIRCGSLQNTQLSIYMKGFCQRLICEMFEMLILQTIVIS
jgi:hypothetical protein